MTASDGTPGIEPNNAPYRFMLSAVGAAILGLLGLMTGALWALALDASVGLVGAIVAIVAALWGAIVVQMTPTGGVIMENKTTTNYAVVALHGWLAFIACTVALVFWAIRALLFS